MIIGGALGLLWKVLSSLTSLTMLALINVPLHGPAKPINSFILRVSQLDILPSSLIIEPLFNISNEFPLNPNFETAGFASTNPILNMGSTFIFLLVDIILLIALGLSKLLGFNSAY
jgi:hypothetical protein